MMASSSSALRISITLQSTRKPLFPSILTNSFQPSQLPSRFAGLTCSSRRRDGGNPPLNPKKNNKKKIAKKEVGEDDDLDEDAFEALFRQLEEDLKNDELDGEEDDQDVSEEDLAKLEKELAEALEDDDFLVALGSAALGGVVNEDDEEEGEEDDDIDVDSDEDGDEVDGEEEEMPVKLRNWQRRRLAYALQDGSRKTSIKKLAADLCMDRAVVLKLLRDPPPDLVILSATLPDKPTKRTKDPVEKQEEPVALETTAKTIKDPVEKQEEPVETTKDAEKPKVEAKAPVHVMQSNWTARKRLKKVHIETLEEVYRRSKRPTDAMISSIVHVTNLPRKRIVKWFEDKREEDGVPEQRVPYEPRASESTITTN
ncbi:protein OVEREXPRESSOR OF CATIONIC PEROXIDASE 3-like [Salvia splendens]|uniref:protein OVEREXPRESSOR OF CATIONIC PEROXIDASE 3-like n=1 Tax=Salvia splendens TaxID=180675 RepID=UPI001C274FB3|nr:protein OVEREXPRESSOR OF CATIONIC PEROXIDASE 3-like [Salvia splendens]